MNFVQKTCLHFGGVRFISCTLWTDFNLAGHPDEAMAAASRQLNDYHLIRFGTGNARPEDTAALHHDHLKWLTDAIAKPFDGRTVVVTHHGPSLCAAGPIDALTPAFCSNLDDWILRHQPALWLFGHTHRHLAGMFGSTPVVNVSLGYPSEVPHGRNEEILFRGLIDTDLPDLLVRKPEF